MPVPVLYLAALAVAAAAEGDCPPPLSLPVASGVGAPVASVEGTLAATLESVW